MSTNEASDSSMSQSMNQFSIDQDVSAKWPDGTTHRASIQRLRELKATKSGGPSEFEYYVHYINYDRRMDEWVTSDRIGPLTKKTMRKIRECEIDLPEKKTKGELNFVEKAQEEFTKIKQIETIEFGRWDMDCWYFSPYPASYQVRNLFVCEYCLKYFRHDHELDQHSHRCRLRAPPGQLIYDEGEVCLYEVDGHEQVLYCQNLCLLGKLFIEHKTIYYDTQVFYFYILCERDNEGSHIVGYFSKDKNSSENYNLACICCLPFVQRDGYGKLLISISYELTKREGKIGSPEKPLSDLGKLSYRSYWSYIVMKALRDSNCSISIKDIAVQNGFKMEDVISTLDVLCLLKVWKGQYVVAISHQMIEEFFQNNKAPRRLCKPECLHWEPHIHTNQPSEK